MVPVNEETIAGWEKCKLVIRHGVGYDNVDLAALERRGIPCCYIPDYCTEDVAEQAIMLILACAPASRQPHGARRFSARGKWDFAGVILSSHGRPDLGNPRLRAHRQPVYQKLQSFGPTSDL
jgi:lactate dehydrogenase-like 2-hydroxyacid dehydrogenase